MAEQTDNFGELCRRADAALQAGAWPEAGALLERALAVDDRQALLHVALGQVLRETGHSAEAEARFQRALVLDASCAEACAGLAAGMERAGRIDERDAFLRRWLSIRIASGAAPAPAAVPVEVPRTTLVCVDCAYHDLAAHALGRVLGRCRFERALLLTDLDIAVPGAETVRIAPIRSAEAYSRFMIKELDRYVDSEFALVVQYDGYVLNGACWSAEFQRYDYVGAPWGPAQGGAVGNGGFSLRSKRLLRALSDPRITALHPEDIAICRTYRALLEERHGIRFAPPGLAARFSFESVAPSGPTFGFHGLDHLYHLLERSDAEVAAYRPPRPAR